MKRKRTVNTFRRYLASYIICLVFPVIIFSAAFYNYFITNYSKQLMKKYDQNIANTFELIDNKITNINTIAQQLLSSRELSTLSLNENSKVGSYFLINKLLNSYTNTNEFINDIWYYNKNQSLFFNTYQMLSVESFEKYGPQYTNIEMNKLIDILNDNKLPTWIGISDVKIYGNTQPLLTYIISFPYAYVSEDSVLLFQLKPSMISQILKSNIDWDSFTTAIINENKDIIYSSNPSLNGLINEISNKNNLNLDIAEVKNVFGKDYYIHIKKYSDTGLCYINALPYDKLTVQTRKFVINLIAIIVICILAGSVLIYVFMIYNYNPINNLVKYVKTQFNSPVKDDNDIDQIKATIQSLANNNQSLKLYNEKYQKDRVLFRIIKGSYSSNEYLINDLKANSLSLISKYYRVLIFRIDDSKIKLDDEFEYIFLNIADNLFIDTKFYFIEYMEINSYIVLASYDVEDDAFKSKIEKLHNNIESIFKTGIMVGIGNICNDPLSISQSYTQARWALRCQINKNDNRILMYSDLNINYKNTYINLELELNTLYETITTKNTGRIDFIISELINTIKNIHISYFYRICLCYDIINKIFKATYDIEGSTVNFKECFQPILYQKDVNNLDELIEIIQKLSKDLIAYLHEDNKYTNEDNFSTILKFIEDNYTKSDFDIQTICNHFKISLSNLSHQFKSKTGQNISLFLNTLKMKYAKNLLMTSDLSVNEIADKLGYFQTSSFIRKFKQIEGITPGEYRNKNS